jgi:hypothetical protein
VHPEHKLTGPKKEEDDDIAFYVLIKSAFVGKGVLNLLNMSRII